MSQFVRVNCTVLDNVKPRTLRKAIQMIPNLNLDLDPKVKRLRNTYGKDEVDCGLTKNGKSLSLGFKFITEREKTKLNIRGDFWMTGLEEKSFKNMVCQRYQIEEVTQQQKATGGRLVARNVESDGTVVMRYAV